MKQLLHKLIPGVLIALVAMVAPVQAQNLSVPPAKPGTAEYNRWLAEAVSRLQRLSDADALRTLAFHYGRGNDAISIHYGDRAKGRRLGTAEYAQAFAPDVKIEVYALGGAKPISATTGIPAWVEFVDNYYAANHYSSSVHLMSNFSINFTDADTARVSNYASVPHFLLAPSAKDKASAETAVEHMLCRYDYEAKRQRDGSWKTTNLKIYLEEILRTDGFYPGGQGKGL